VDIEVFRFEANSAREPTIGQARWTVIDEGGKAPLNVKESRLT
jgi:hypothetical protein